MAFETILINADSEERLSGVLAVAFAIASERNSQLLAMASLPRPIALPGGMPGEPEVIHLDRHRTAARQEAERMRKEFEASSRGQPLSTEWRLDDSTTGRDTDALIAQAHLTDLIVTANAKRGADGNHTFHTAERLVIEAGRPVILVPKAYAASAAGSRILIAWNGSREASRAVFDAMPLLQKAQHVKVLHIETAASSKVNLANCAAITSTLRRHRVRAIYEELTLPRASEGAALLSAAKAENASLLVMGGYGHWRFRELVLGGVTRYVLRHMMVPVLMSH